MNPPAPSTKSNFIGNQNPAYQLQESGYDTSALQQVSPTGQNIQTGINTAGAAPFTQSQVGLLGALGAQASGTGGPTVANQQLQSGVNANLASALASTASSANMGQNPGLAAKGAQTTLANTNAVAAGQAAATRAGEQLNAQGQLGQLATAGAGQQLQQAQAQEQATEAGQEFGATQGQQAAEYNTGLAAAQQAQYNQGITGLAMQNQASNNQLENQVLNPSTYLNMLSGGSSALGSAGGSGGAAAALSDESVKTGISTEAATANQFLAALGQYMKPMDAPQLTPLAGTQGGSGGQKAQPQQPTSPLGDPGNAGPTGSIAENTVQDTPQIASDERSKDHIDQLTDQNSKLTDALHAAVGGTASAGEAQPQPSPSIFPTGSRAWNIAQGNGNVLGMPPQITTAQPTMLPPDQNPAGQPYAPLVVPATPPPSDDVVMPQTPQTSDENEKKLVDHLENHSYQYKDPSMPGAAPGTHFGPMAQELEKAGPMGASTVAQGPDGVKRVDTGRLSLALAGALGAMNNRVETLEAALSKAHGKAA